MSSCLTAACCRLMAYFVGCERAGMRPVNAVAAEASGANPLTHDDALEELDRLGYTAGTLVFRDFGGGRILVVSDTRPTMAGEAWLMGAKSGLPSSAEVAELVGKTAKADGLL